MEYKLSSFQFSDEINRDDKHHAIMRINSVRSKCPSDGSFTGKFAHENNLYHGEIKVLFSKGTFFVSKSASSMSDLMTVLIGGLDDQIAVWKDVRFDQPETFIDYGEFINKGGATGS